MRKLNRFLFLTVIAIVVALFGVSSQILAQGGDKKPSSNIKINYDKKKDITTVRLKAFRITTLVLEKEVRSGIPLHQTDLEISYVFSGQEATKSVENVTFKFKITAGNYAFLRPQSVIAVLDKDTEGQGRAFALGDSDYKSFPPITNSIYEENLVVNAPSDALAKMAKANSLQIYLGPIAYSISANQLNSIKELAAMLPVATAAKSN